MRSISYVNDLIVTCLSWLWRHVACNDLYPFRQRGSLLLCKSTETNAEKYLLWDSRSYGYFRRHRSRGDLRNKSKRRSITMHFGQVWQSLSCQKVCYTFSVLLCCYLLFSRLSSSLTMLPLTTTLDMRRFRWKTNEMRENARRKQRPRERPIESLSS